MYLNLQLLFLFHFLYFTKALEQLQKPISSVLGSDFMKGCGDDSTAMQIKDLTLTPDFPEAGKPLDIAVKGHLAEEIAEGSQGILVVKLGPIKLANKSIDLCDELFNGTSVECPVAPGDIDFVKTVDMPAAIAHGNYELHFDAISPDDDDLACVRGQFNFRY